ncbi:putative cytochrome P450 hydroxylase [Alloactinosynnema sp. L-07]|uniref:cytochrome P450 n=1 Tax=Alloactinosynnema sp. L-07 TaxID=1653480 RepID=UPI00065F0934|nr:cytochrome P450 [Alloactinosynnema sp. L-07]CRK61970.1 putative cytochrome P450 hydroxylase [Alloactinosynnema sp. L-07]
MTTYQETLLAYPFARTSALDPSPELARLRAAGPIHRVRTAAGAAWLVTRHTEVRELLSSPAFGTGYPGALPTGADDLTTGFMFLHNPPEHTRLRRSVARAFTARRVAELGERARVIAADLVATMREHGPVLDLQAEFAFPLPIAITAELLGIPEPDRARFRGWADIVLRPADAAGDCAAAFTDLQHFIVDLVDAKPDGPDLLSDLIREPDGLNRLEIAAMALGLLMAGYVTTASAIAHGMLRLLTTPSALAALRAGTVHTGRAVEELLRLQDEEIGVNRVARSDLDLCGVRIEAGETVIASRSGANRDPSIYHAPDQFDPAADRVPHLGFGHGIHHCLGAALARMELAVALDTLLTGLPGLHLAVPLDEVRWSAQGMDVAIETLPVAW